MFANPAWSVLLLFAPVALYYFVIRPRLRVTFSDTYAYIDGFWRRVWARFYAFRSFFVATLGTVMVALPDLLTAVSGADLSFLPQPWPGYVGTGTAIALTLIRAFSTTPGNSPPG